MKKLYEGLLLGTFICIAPSLGHTGFYGPNLVCPCPVPPPVGICVPVTGDLGAGFYGMADHFRSIAGLVASVIGLTGDGEAKARLIAKQEENNQKASGGGGSSSSTNTSSGKLNLGSAGASEFSGSAFDYVNAYVLAKEGGATYEPLKNALASSDREKIRTAVLAFFADPEKSEQTTTEYKNQVVASRNEYAKEAASRHITLAYRVKGHIQNDLSAITSAAVSGDGELGSIAVDAHTLEQMVKMELVDLALQIEMMEAEAIQFLMHQPVELMPKTKPTS